MVDPLSSATTSGAQHAHFGHQHHARRAVMSSVSQKLGMNEHDLAGELKAGKSLSDIAQEKGVSADDLKGAIEDGMKNAGVSTASQSSLDDMADKIAAFHRKSAPATPPASGPTDPPAEGDSTLGTIYA
jgi:hypothetical protein